MFSKTKAILDILKAIDSLQSITSVDISETRQAMDKLLKTMEGKWYFVDR